MIFSFIIANLRLGQDTCLCNLFRGSRGIALHLKLCILFARATSAIPKVIMSPRRGAEGYDTLTQHWQRKEQPSWSLTRRKVTVLVCFCANSAWVRVTQARQGSPGRIMLQPGPGRAYCAGRQDELLVGPNAWVCFYSNWKPKLEPKALQANNLTSFSLLELECLFRFQSESMTDKRAITS